MRRCAFIAAGLLAPWVARANPVMIDPVSLIAFGMVALWALVIEAGVVALLLALTRLEPLRTFGGFLVLNLAVFLFVFHPLLQRQSVPLPALEALVVLLDGAALKLLAMFDAMQGENFRGLSWARATGIAAVGNACSYFIGVIARDTPWESHM